MSSITYREYLKYMEAEFSKIDTSTLSVEEKEYYSVVKKDFDNSKNMPPRILNGPILSKTKIVDNQITENIRYIKEKIQDNHLKQPVFKEKISNFNFVAKFVIALISIIVYIFSSLAFPIRITVNIPNFVWHEVKDNSNIIPTAEPIDPLVGAGGLDESKERYVLDVTWEKSNFDITYVAWSIIPLSIFILIAYSSAIRWPSFK